MGHHKQSSLFNSPTKGPLFVAHNSHVVGSGGCERRRISAGMKTTSRKTRNEKRTLIKSSFGIILNCMTDDSWH